VGSEMCIRDRLGCEESSLLGQTGGLAKLQRAGFALKFSEHDRQLEVS
jgi:hypothetical protein